MNQKLNEENIENNLVFCIDPRKAFSIKSIPRSVFRNRLPQNKIFYFGYIFISVSLQNHDETDCVSEKYSKKKWVWTALSQAVCLSPLLKRSDDLSNKQVGFFKRKPGEVNITIFK